jgi:hypothetical protein
MEKAAAQPRQFYLEKTVQQLEEGNQFTSTFTFGFRIKKNVGIHSTVLSEPNHIISGLNVTATRRN